MIPLELPESQKTPQEVGLADTPTSSRTESIQRSERSPPTEDPAGPLSKIRKIGKAYVYLDLLIKAAIFLVLGVAAVAAVLLAIIKGDFRLLSETWPIALIFLGLFWLVRWIRLDVKKFNKGMGSKRRPRFEFQQEQTIEPTNTNVQARNPD